MALTQMQLIQSLGEAMAWFEREMGWGVPPTELRHLSGRLGELYAALITNGQMATDVNQQGYDVVGGNGERISVKTTAMIAYSGRFRPAIPEEAGHPFRLIPATHSGANRPSIPDDSGHPY